MGRKERLEEVRRRLVRARDASDVAGGDGEVEYDTVSEFLQLLDRVDQERDALWASATRVDHLIKTVHKEMAETIGSDVSKVHQDALAAAAHLWQVSMTPEVKDERKPRRRKQYLMNHLTRMDELTRVTSPEEPPSSAAAADTMREIPTSPHETPPLPVTRNPGQALGRKEAASDGWKRSRARRSVAKEGKKAKVLASQEDRVRARHAAASRHVGGAEVGKESWRESSSWRAEGGVEVAAAVVDVVQVAHDPRLIEVAPTLVSQAVGTTAEVSVLPERSITRVADSSVPKEGRREGGRMALAATEAVEVEVVVESPSVVLDVDARVEDDGPDSLTVSLKVLDILALLLEKVLFVAIPSVVSGGALVWARVDNAVNGGKGQRGWRLLPLLKKD